MSQKAPLRPFGRHFLSSASPHCYYFESLICLEISARSAFGQTPDAMADQAIGFRDCYVVGWPEARSVEA